jgi:hypothetical protein
MDAHEELPSGFVTELLAVNDCAPVAVKKTSDCANDAASVCTRERKSEVSASIYGVQLLGLSFRS